MLFIRTHGEGREKKNLVKFRNFGLRFPRRALRTEQFSSSRVIDSLETRISFNLRRMGCFFRRQSIECEFLEIQIRWFERVFAKKLKREKGEAALHKWSGGSDFAFERKQGGEGVSGEIGERSADLHG